ncbi:MAG: hypothetical protein ABL986_15215 [Vicinamibacterales bacterium]
MAEQTTDEIAADIRDHRDELGANLRELEGRVSMATDWKHYVDRYPMATLGAAVGGGILLALWTNERRESGHPDSELTQALVAPRRPSWPLQERTRETIGLIQGALIGLGISRLTEFMDQKIPGFRDHFEQSRNQSTRFVR